MRKERSGSGPISQSVVRSFDLHPPDVERLRAGLFLTGVRVVSAPPIRRGDRLKGEELRAFSGLPWWYGNNAGKGTEYWMFFNPQGEFVPGGSTMRLGLQRSQRSVIRSLGIENDRICFARLSGKFCTAIYRNPEGTRESNDEYIVLVLSPSISYFVEFPISAYEERPPALKDKAFND